jgi:hypothetical protein
MYYCRDALISLEYNGVVVKDPPLDLENYLIQSIRSNLVRLNIEPIHLEGERRTVSKTTVTYKTETPILDPKIALEAIILCYEI